MKQATMKVIADHLLIKATYVHVYILVETFWLIQKHLEECVRLHKLYHICKITHSKKVMAHTYSISNKQKLRCESDARGR